MTPSPDYDQDKAFLIAELRQIGIKHTPEKIIRIAKTSDGKIVGYQGKKHDQPRPIYEFTFKGKTQYISISVSENGYIVGANPKTQIK